MLVSAAETGAYCKGKRGLFIAVGKRLEKVPTKDVWVCVASRGSLELAPSAVAVGHGKMVVTFNRTGGGQ